MIQFLNTKPRVLIGMEDLALDPKAMTLYKSTTAERDMVLIHHDPKRGPLYAFRHYQLNEPKQPQYFQVLAMSLQGEEGTFMAADRFQGRDGQPFGSHVIFLEGCYKGYSREFYVAGAETSISSQAARVKDAFSLEFKRMENDAEVADLFAHGAVFGFAVQNPKHPYFPDVR